jgi:hypothetical protein
MMTRHVSVYDEAWDMIEFGFRSAARIVRNRREFRRLAVAALDVFEFRRRSLPASLDFPPLAIAGEAGPPNDPDRPDAMDEEPGILFMSEDGRVWGGNKAWQTLCGSRARGGQPPLLADMIAPNDRDAFDRTLDTLRHEAREASLTCDLLAEDQSPCRVRMQICTPPAYEGSGTELLAVAFARMPDRELASAIKRANLMADEWEKRDRGAL